MKTFIDPVYNEKKQKWEGLKNFHKKKDFSISKPSISGYCDFLKGSINAVAKENGLPVKFKIPRKLKKRLKKIGSLSKILICNYEKERLECNKKLADIFLKS